MEKERKSKSIWTDMLVGSHGIDFAEEKVFREDLITAIEHSGINKKIIIRVLSGLLNHYIKKQK